MLEKNRLGVAPRVYFRPEFQNCPHCESKLRRTHTTWEKKIVTTNGILHAWSMAYACKNLDCLHTRVSYKSTEAEMLSLKHTSYGYDVLALVVELRFKQHRTVKEIVDADRKLKMELKKSMRGIRDIELEGAWNSYIVRNGEIIVLVDDALRQEHVISRLRSVSFGDYKKRKTQWDQRLSGVILRKKCNRNTESYLNDLE